MPRKVSKSAVDLSGISYSVGGNDASDRELLELFKAYREKVDAQGNQSASREQDRFQARLDQLIDQIAGVTYRRNAKGAVEHDATGWLALECGLSDRAEEFADRIKKRIENNADRDGRILHEWTETGGASIASYVTYQGRRIAQDMGREAVEDGISAAEELPSARGNVATADMSAQEAKMHLRKKADEAIKAHKETGEKLPSIEFKSMSDFEPGNQQDADVRSPDPLPAQLKSPESPLSSPLRVGSLVNRLLRLSDEMCQPSSSVIVKGQKRILTSNHANIWRAYLGLSSDQHQNLDVSLAELCQRNGWQLRNAKAWLADCFAFLQAHPKFDEICDLMVPSTMSKRASPVQLEVRRNDVKNALRGEEGQGRANFRKLIQLWITKYGNVPALAAIKKPLP